MISDLLLGIVLSVRTYWFHKMVTLPSRLASNNFDTFIIIIIIIITTTDVIIVITVAAVKYHFPSATDDTEVLFAYRREP
jgi:hypothetical protein